MIELHRLDNSILMINTDLIESIQEVPDTVVTLSNGNRYIMRENVDEILTKIIDFKFAPPIGKKRGRSKKAG